MQLTQCNDMVDALATDRPDHPLGKGVLPRRTRRNRLVPDAHGSQSAGDGRTIDRIAVADQVPWNLIVPRKCFGDLLRNPFRRRVAGDIDPDQFPPSQPNDDQDVE